MAELLDGVVGNPSGSHHVARRSKRTIEDARDAVAAAVGARPAEVIFTSGGTESDNLAVFGVAAATGGTVVCSAVEHHAVLDPVHALGGETVRVHSDGRLDLADLADRCDATTSLVSVMTANNEVGVIQSISEVAEVVREHAPNAVVHTDAVQAAPWLDLTECTAAADLVTVSAHKLGGPAGIGALVVRDGVPLDPRQIGGGQELERRGGTPSTMLIAGAGAAFGSIEERRVEASDRVRGLRDRLVRGALEIPGVRRTADTDTTRLLPGHAHLCFADVDSEALLFLLDAAGIAASAGSSCASGAVQISHVVEAMGVTNDFARGSVRFTVGKTTTEADIDTVLSVLAPSVDRLRRTDR